MRGYAIDAERRHAWPLFLLEINMIEQTLLFGSSDDAPKRLQSEWPARLVADSLRMQFLPKLFGARLMLHGEGLVYGFMRAMTDEYTGGMWDYYVLPNNARYMAPQATEQFHLVSPNGYERTVSADAAGVIMTLMALSHASFDDRTDTCADNFHLLREMLSKHPEAAEIFAITD